MAPEPVNRLIHACLLGGVLVSAGCTTYVPGGVNTTKTAAASADDGSGMPVTDHYPPTPLAIDRNSFAVSSPIDYRQFFVLTHAKVGGGKHTATAAGTGATTSYFTVEKLLGSEDITISAHTSLTPDITSGVGTATFSVQLIDKGSGSRVGPLHTYTYTAGPNSASPQMIDIKLNGALLTTVANSTQYDDVQTFPVTLQNGTYQYDLSWNVVSTADGMAELTAYTYLEAK